MKVAVSSTGPDLQAAVDPRFGRCTFFLIVETDDLSFEAIENSNASAGGGAGIQSALLVSKKEAKVVLTGNCGPNAEKTLKAGGIDVVLNCSGVITDVLKDFKSGKFKIAEGPNVESHAGMNSGS